LSSGGTPGTGEGGAVGEDKLKGVGYLHYVWDKLRYYKNKQGSWDSIHHTKATHYKHFPFSFLSLYSAKRGYAVWGRVW
jgi:hypothetical protein